MSTVINISTHNIPGHAFTLTLNRTTGAGHYVCEDADELQRVIRDFMSDKNVLQMSVTNERCDIVAYWNREALDPNAL